MSTGNKLIHAATRENQYIFYVLNPKNDSEDGAIFDGETLAYVPFWSFVGRVNIDVRTDNDFLRALWRDARTDPLWEDKFVKRTRRFPHREAIEKEIVSPDDIRNYNFLKKKSDGLIRVKVARLAAAYDPDAEDGDGDGIVQDGTPWERPAGTKFLDELGNELPKGFSATERPSGSRLVDADGNNVDYSPKQPDTPETPEEIGRPARAQSLKDQGFRTIDDIRHPIREQAAAAAETEKARQAEEKRKLAERKAREAVAPKKEKVDTPEDVAGTPGVTVDSADSVGMPEPQKPRRPFEPLPPAFSGKAREWAVTSSGDYDDLLTRMNEEGFVVFDYETTGFDEGAMNRPVQIGAVRFEGGRPVERLNVFVRPGEKLSTWSRENLLDRDGNPLTDEWLEENGMDMADAHRALAEFMGQQVVVAHNAKFDREIFDRIGRESGIDFTPSGQVDTLKLTRDMLQKGDGETAPRGHKLGELADFFGVPLGNKAHTADADSEATGQVLISALRYGAERELDSSAIDVDMQESRHARESAEFADKMVAYQDALTQYKKDYAEYQHIAMQGRDRKPMALDAPEDARIAALGDEAPRWLDDSYDAELVQTRDGQPALSVGSPLGGFVELRAGDIEQGLLDAASREVSPELRVGNLEAFRRNAIERLLIDRNVVPPLNDEQREQITSEITQSLPPGFEVRHDADDFSLFSIVNSESGEEVGAGPYVVSDFIQATSQVDANGKVTAIGYGLQSREKVFRISNAIGRDRATDLTARLMGDALTVDALEDDGFSIRTTDNGRVFEFVLDPERAGFPESVSEASLRVIMDDASGVARIESPSSGEFTEIALADIANNPSDFVSKVEELLSEISDKRDEIAEEQQRRYEANSAFYDDAQRRSDLLKASRRLRQDYEAAKANQDFRRARAIADEIRQLYIEDSERIADARAEAGRMLDPEDAPKMKGDNGVAMEDVIDIFDAPEYDDLLAFVSEIHNVERVKDGDAPDTFVAYLPNSEFISGAKTTWSGSFYHRDPRAISTDVGEAIRAKDGAVIAVFDQGPRGGSRTAADPQIPWSDEMERRRSFLHELGHRVDALPLDNEWGQPNFMHSDAPVVDEFLTAFEDIYRDDIAFDLDTMRNFEYWYDPAEIFARAWAAYILDKTGEPSTTFVAVEGQHPDVDYYRPMFPYVEGILQFRKLMKPLG